MNNRLKKIFVWWIPLAFVILCCSMLTYVAVQQEYRQSANDPQIQLAEEVSSAISSGASLQGINASDTVDIAQSLAPYIVIYDASGNPINGTGMLNGKLPSLPAGVFNNVRTNGEDAFTWQPEAGVRSAVVVDPVTSASGGFVMSGRSLREVEMRENDLTFQVFAISLFALLGSLLLVIAGTFLV